MNIIDIIIVAAFALSIALGLKDGAIRQLGTLCAIVVAIILAKSFGSTVSAFLGIGGDHSALWGYLIVLIVSLVCVGFVATLLRKVISAVGLGPLDRIAGAVLSFIKCALLLSILFTLFNFVNSTINLVDSATINSSKLYKPVVSTSQYIMPAIDWVGKQLPIEEAQ